MSNAASAERGTTRRAAWWAFKQLAVVAICLSLIAVAIWLATDANHFWPVWAMLGLLVALLQAAWQVWGPPEDVIGEARERDDGPA